MRILINEEKSKLFSCFEVDELFIYIYIYSDFFIWNLKYEIFKSWKDILKFISEKYVENSFVAKIDDIDSVFNKSRVKKGRIIIKLHLF